MTAGDPPFPLDAQTREMIRLLREASARARKIMLNPPGKTAKAQAFASSGAAQLLAGFNRELDVIKGRLVKVAAAKVAGAYKDGLAAGDKLARDAGVAVDGSPLRGGFTVVDARRAQVLAQQTVGDLAKAVDSMRETTGVVVRQIQAAGLDKAAVNRLLAGGTLSGQPQQTMREIKKLVRSAAGEGKLIHAGGRSFQPDDYAEMVFQTKLAETTNVATVQRLQARGLYYVKIIGSNSANFCTDYVGRAFYTGPGIDPLGLFPHVRDLQRGGPPFHPRCTKRYVAFVPRLATPEQIEGAKTPLEPKRLGQAKAAGAVKAPDGKPGLRQGPHSPPAPVTSPVTKRPIAPMPKIDVAQPAIRSIAERGARRLAEAGHEISPIVSRRSLFGSEAAKRDPAAFFRKRGVIAFNPRFDGWDAIEAKIAQRALQGWWSTDDPDYLLFHEAAHDLHFKAIQNDRYEALARMSLGAVERVIALEVSGYAAKSPLEFVAEVFAARMAGEVFSAAVMNLYKMWEGP